jgi:hypothetical protein
MAPPPATATAPDAAGRREELEELEELEEVEDDVFAGPDDDYGSDERGE